jgi:hypothetical protein
MSRYAAVASGLIYGAHRAIQAVAGYSKVASMAGNAGAVLKGRREIIADPLHAEGWSYGIAEHLTTDGLLFASMHTAMENGSLLRRMIC